MDKQKEGQLIRLIAIIVILLTFVLVAIGSCLSLTSSREDAFRVEANNILEASDKAIDKIIDKKLELSKDGNSCKIKDGRYCFTVNYLVKNNFYDNDAEKYSGKIIASNKNNNKELYLKKNDEFKIIGGSSIDYKKSGTLSLFDWKEDYTICECK